MHNADSTERRASSISSARLPTPRRRNSLLYVGYARADGTAGALGPAALESALSVRHPIHFASPPARSKPDRLSALILGRRVTQWTGWRGAPVIRVVRLAVGRPSAYTDASLQVAKTRSWRRSRTRSWRRSRTRTRSLGVRRTSPIRKMLGRHAILPQN